MSQDRCAHPLKIPSPPDFHDKIGRITRGGMGIADDRVDVKLAHRAGEGFGPAFFRQRKNLKMQGGCLDSHLLLLADTGMPPH